MSSEKTVMRGNCLARHHCTEVLDNTSNHYVRLRREAIEIHKHQHSFNKKRKKSETEQSLASSTGKYSLQKVNKLY